MFIFKRERVFIILFLLLCSIFLLNIGYAKNDYYIASYNEFKDFDIQYDNPKVVNTVGVDRNKTYIKTSEDKHSLSINIPELQYPGSKVEFSVDVVNNGTIDAKIDSVIANGFENSKAIKFSVLNDNILKDTVFKAGKSINLKFKIEWDENVNILTDEVLNFNINVNCVEAL